jgi:hypothetical protein
MIDTKALTMEKLQISVTDKRTKNLVIRLLNSIEGVEIATPHRVHPADPSDSLKSLAGIWKGRDVSLEGIREKAWKRSTK